MFAAEHLIFFNLRRFKSVFAAVDRVIVIQAA